MSIFQKYGGQKTIRKIVIGFYDRIQKVEHLDAYFDGVDWNLLIQHQTNFLSEALGGPSLYEGRAIDEAHQHLNITAENFDEVAEILEETLESFQLETQDIDTIVGFFNKHKPQVVSKISGM